MKDIQEILQDYGVVGHFDEACNNARAVLEAAAEYYELTHPHATLSIAVLRQASDELAFLSKPECE